MNNLVISPSSLDDMQLCWRKFNYRKILGFTPRIKATALDRGSLIHAALASYYKQLIASDYNLKEVNVIGIIQEARMQSVEMNLETAELEFIIKVLNDYFSYYSTDIWKPLLVEQPFTKVLFESAELDLRIILEGRIDLIAEDKDGKVIVDHKSSEQNRRPSSLSNQFIGYPAATDINRLVINFLGLQKTFKPKERFIRYPLNYQQDVLDEWIESVIWWVIEAQKRIKENYFPPNYTSCDKWSGCQFRSICESTKANRDWKIQIDFEKRGSDIYQEKQ